MGVIRGWGLWGWVGRVGEVRGLVMIWVGVVKDGGSSEKLDGYG